MSYSYIPGYTSAVITPTSTKPTSGTTMNYAWKPPAPTSDGYKNTVSLSPSGAMVRTPTKIAPGMTSADLSIFGQYDGRSGVIPGITDTGYNPTTTTTSGGSSGYGGGYSTPNVDMSSILALLNRSPQTYKYTPVDLPEYQGTGFYDFNTDMYDTAKQGIQTGIADARQRGDTAFDLSAQRYLNYQDPYASGPQTYNPGVDPRLMDSMAAWGGAGSGAAAETYGQGVQADGAMRAVYDLLGKVGNQFNEGQLAGIEGDRMQLDQRLGSEERMLGLGVDMALARAKSQYEKDKWQYGEEIARSNYETRKAEILYNNQGVNQAAQSNTQMTNDFNKSNVSTLIDLIASGQKVDPSLLKQFMGA